MNKLQQQGNKSEKSEQSQSEYDISYNIIYHATIQCHGYTGTVDHLPFNAKMYQQHFLFAGGYKIIMTNHIETVFVSFSCLNAMIN